MKANTRLFGEIDIPEEKIVHMVNGLVGFPEIKKFTLIYDEEKEDPQGSIMWFQSMDTPEFAIPVIRCDIVDPDYAPDVDAECLKPLGELSPSNTFIVLTVRVPADPKEATVNMKAPIIINSEANLGDQIIVEGDYPVRCSIYDKLQERAGE